MSNRPEQLKQLLLNIETEMRRLQLWSNTEPSPSALASPEPFCVDTLPLSDWIQWILIPRMHEIIDKGLPLPNRCGVYPIAEESFKGLENNGRILLELIGEIDTRLINIY